jgi:hypothetical protein
LARVSSTEDPDSLLRYVNARADLADREVEQEATPEEIQARHAEARLQRLLIGMILLIVVGGFVISITGLILFGGTAQ